MKQYTPNRASFAILAAACITLHAQTATDYNEGLQLKYLSSTNSYQLSWWARASNTYFLQYSENLTSWSYFPIIETGSGAVINCGFTSSTPRFFLRLQSTEVTSSDAEAADFDGDGYSNAEEIQRHMNPIVASVDTDTDGLPDEWEIRHFGLITITQGNSDGDGDTLSDLREFTVATDPKNAYSLPDGARDDTRDRDGDGVEDWKEARAGTNFNDANDTAPTVPSFAVLKLGQDRVIKYVTNNGWVLFEETASNSYRTSGLWHNGQIVPIPGGGQIYYSGLNYWGPKITTMNNLGDYSEIYSVNPTTNAPREQIIRNTGSLIALPQGSAGGDTYVVSMSDNFAVGTAAWHLSTDNSVSGWCEIVSQYQDLWYNGAFWSLGGSVVQLGSMNFYQRRYSEACPPEITNSAFSGAIHGPKYVNNNGHVVSRVITGNFGRSITELTDEYDDFSGTRLDFTALGLNDNDRLIGTSPGRQAVWREGSATNLLSREPVIPMSINNEDSILTYDSTDFGGLSIFFKTGSTQPQYIRHVVDEMLPKGWTVYRSPINAYYQTHLLSDSHVMGVYANQQALDASGNPTGPAQKYSILAFPAALTVDSNRDGELRPSIIANAGLSGSIDRTSEVYPFRFWLNDDDDHVVDSSIIGVYSEVEDDDRNITNVQNEDWRNNVLDTPRDLEDFARLWVNTQGLNDSFKNGQLYLGLKWKNTTGTPAIKLYKSKDATGSADYLFNTSAASQQSLAVAIIDARYPDYVLDGNFQSDHTLIEGSDVFILPSAQFSALSESNPRTAFLFEGCKAGKGELALVILKKEGANYTEIGEGPGVWLDLKAPKDFIERWSAGDDALGAVQPAVRENSKSVSPAWGSPATDEEKDYVLYVHGYNMQEFEKQRWIETTYKRLYHLGYKGRVGGFTWPCAQSAPPYDESEERAWEAAVQLNALLSSLKIAGYRVHLMAHSQGNVVAGEALRQWKEAGNTTPLVRTYIASQAAIQAHCYDIGAPLIPGFAGSLSDDGTPNVYVNYPLTGAPYMDAVAMSGTANSWLNFENPRDYALTGNSLDPLNFHPGWQANQRLKPDAGSGMGYNAVDGFFTSTPTGIRPLIIPAERFKILSYLAEGRSLALGSTTTAGVFAGNNIDLSLAPLGYAEHHRFHSGQFRSFMSERYEYWRRLMLGIGLQPFTP